MHLNSGIHPTSTWVENVPDPQPILLLQLDPSSLNHSLAAVFSVLLWNLNSPLLIDWAVYRLEK